MGLWQYWNLCEEMIVALRFIYLLERRGESKHMSRAVRGGRKWEREKKSRLRPEPWPGAQCDSPEIRTLSSWLKQKPRVWCFNSWTIQVPLRVALEVKYEKMSDLGCEGFKPRETRVQNLQVGNELGVLFWRNKMWSGGLWYVRRRDSWGEKPVETVTVTATEMNFSYVFGLRHWVPPGGVFNRVGWGEVCK